MHHLSRSRSRAKNSDQRSKRNAQLQQLRGLLPSKAFLLAQSAREAAWYPYQPGGGLSWGWDSCNSSAVLSVVHHQPSLFVFQKWWYLALVWSFVLVIGAVSQRKANGCDQQVASAAGLDLWGANFPGEAMKPFNAFGGVNRPFQTWCAPVFFP